MLSEMFSFLFAPYNLPFTIMLGVCVLLAALQLVGLGGDGDTDADLDADVDIDADVDVDLDADADLDVDGDVDADADADIDEIPGALSILAFLGVGKAPLLVILLILLGSMGVLGWTFNNILQTLLGVYPSWGLWAVFPVTIVVGSFVSSRTARLIGRALPPVSTTATSAVGLLGKRGTVISPRIDGKYGLVRVRDQGGTLINVFAITQDNEPINSKSEVALIDYDAEKKRYTVSPIDRK